MNDYKNDCICLCPWFLDSRTDICHQTKLLLLSSHLLSMLSFSKSEKNIFAKRCAIFPRRQQAADVGVPVTRSLSGPITAWSPSAVNSMLSLLELMSRFRACPWASFGPAATKTTARIPEGVWQHYMEMLQSSKSNLPPPVILLKSAVLREYNETHSRFAVWKSQLPHMQRSSGKKSE